MQQDVRLRDRVGPDPDKFYYTNTSIVLFLFMCFQTDGGLSNTLNVTSKKDYRKLAKSKKHHVHFSVYLSNVTNVKANVGYFGAGCMDA